MEYMKVTQVRGNNGGFLTVGFVFCASREKLRALFKKGAPISYRAMR